MKGLVHIGNSDIRIKVYKGQRVVTFEEIDTVHERPAGTAGRNFRKNRERFIEDEDYFRLEGDNLKSYKINFDTTNFVPSKINRELILITESGYLMLTKSLNDDLAWTVQRQLVNGYFRSKERARQQRLNPQWQEARDRSKRTRLAAATEIKAFVEYAKLSGSGKPDMYYIHFSNLINDAVGLDSGERDFASAKILSTIELLEDLIRHVVPEQIAEGIYYKDIYKNCKTKINGAMQFVYLPEQKLLTA